MKLIAQARCSPREILGSLHLARFLLCEETWGYKEGFPAMVDQHSKSWQFLPITHRKGTPHIDIGINCFPNDNTLGLIIHKIEVQILLVQNNFPAQSIVANLSALSYFSKGVLGCNSWKCIHQNTFTWGKSSCIWQVFCLFASTKQKAWLLDRLTEWPLGLWSRCKVLPDRKSRVIFYFLADCSCEK